MTAALFGLLGVIVGAVTSGVVDWQLKRRLEAAELRAALRLLLSDFYTAQALLRPVRETGAWGPEPTAIPSDAFAQHRQTIAASLEFEMWKQVEGAVLGVRHLQGIRTEAERDERAFSDEELGHFDRIGAWVDDTILMLEPLLAGSHR